MNRQIVLSIRNPFLLDVSTYLSVAAMAVLGVSGLDHPGLQVAAVGLCGVFGLLYRFLFRTGRYERNPALYFGGQAGVLILLFLLKSEANDAFNFLFYILTVHAAVVLNLRAATLWGAVYFVIASLAVLVLRGLDGWFAILFYLVAFVVCGILGHTVQETELARARNQDLLEELQAAQRRLQELAVVEERNRLARDLHDSVKQQVFAISMQLGAARAVLQESDRAYPPVIEAERLANQAGAELTTLIRELRPPELAHQTLVPALEQFLVDWSRRNGIETALVAPANLPVSPAVEQTLFRVAQEALANVARHSQAKKVTVTWTADDESVRLVIEDNGTGFAQGEVIPGVGLNSMRERLAAVGGELDVWSEKEIGTRITAKCGISASIRSV